MLPDIIPGDRLQVTVPYGRWLTAGLYEFKIVRRCSRQPKFEVRFVLEVVSPSGYFSLEAGVQRLTNDPDDHTLAVFLGRDEYPCDGTLIHSLEAQLQCSLDKTGTL